MTYVNPPIDSTDARERREADAIAADTAAAEQRRHDAECRDGWLGEDSTGRPVACSRCRPHLGRVACWTCGARAPACAMKRNARLGACCSECDHQPHHAKAVTT